MFAWMIRPHVIMLYDNALSLINAAGSEAEDVERSLLNTSHHPSYLHCTASFNKMLFAMLFLIVLKQLSQQF